MSLFQKKPLAGSSVPLYTLGLNKAILLVGLGNPGKTYAGTRHNIGFACLDTFVKTSEFADWIHKKDLKSLVSTGSLGATRVIAIKPTTYMNLSGEAVQAVAQFYKIHPEQILVIHDELDIAFGQIRLRPGGSSAGHNGIKSIIEHLGDAFSRVRIGVKNEDTGRMESADFVLQKFTKEEQTHLPNLAREVTSVLNEHAFGDGQLPTETRSFLA